MESLKFPTPKQVSKVTHNLTLAVEKQALEKVKSNGKPYVATQVDEALKQVGISLETIARKIKEQLEATIITTEPILEPLEINGEVQYEEIVDSNGETKLKPILTPVMIEKETGRGVKLVPAMKAVQKPDYKVNQFALNFFKEVLIASKDEKESGFRDGVESATALMEFFKNNPEIAKSFQTKMGNEVADAFFEEIAT